MVFSNSSLNLDIFAKSLAFDVRLARPKTSVDLDFEIFLNICAYIFVSGGRGTEAHFQVTLL